LRVGSTAGGAGEAAKTNDIKVAFPLSEGASMQTLLFPSRPRCQPPTSSSLQQSWFSHFVTLTSKNGDCAATAHQALSLLAAKRALDHQPEDRVPRRRDAQIGAQSVRSR